MKQKLRILGVLWALCFICPLKTAFSQAEHKHAAAPNWHLSAQSMEGDYPDGDVEGNAQPRRLDPIAATIVKAAKAQVGNVFYDASYVEIPYPNGDVPSDRGLCADVVVRALRAVGYDLQYLIHEDRLRNVRLYPRTWGWGRNGPDSNSDHRCVPNQIFFFQRFGLTLSKDVTEDTIDQWQPGDLVYWNTGSPLLHAGIVSDGFNDEGCPLVIHMSGDDCAEDDSLLAWPIIGHFRFPVRIDPKAKDQEQDVDAGQ